MSTNDVPGYKEENRDDLHATCWAEHEDGSLIFVESTEANRVIYSIFDMAHDPPIEYRDAMPEVSFKSTFSWDPAATKKTKKLNEKWTWHDKTPFPWDRIIKGGGTDGPRYAAAEHITTAAERIRTSRERHSTAAQRVADELRLRGEELDRSDFEDRMETVLGRVAGMFERIVGAAERAGNKFRGKSSGRSARR
jgi:hypothetical protein